MNPRKITREALTSLANKRDELQSALGTQGLTGAAKREIKKSLDVVSSKLDDALGTKTPGRKLEEETANLKAATELDAQERNYVQQLVDEHGMKKVLGYGALGAGGLTGAVALGHRILTPDQEQMIVDEPDESGLTPLEVIAIGGLAYGSGSAFGDDLSTADEDLLRSITADAVVPEAHGHSAPEQRIKRKGGARMAGRY